MTATLPIDLVFEILTWLPGKQLCRSKCVCKAWRTMIRSREFMELYRKRQYGLMLHWWDNGRVMQLRSFHCRFGQNKEVFTPLRGTEASENCFVFATQIINGMVIVVDLERNARGSILSMTVHNLCTGDKMLVSTCRLYSARYVSYAYMYFMYDPTTGIYKVLWLFFSRSGNSFRSAKILVLQRPPCTWRAVDCKSGLNLVRMDFAAPLERVDANDGITCWLATRNRLLCFGSAEEKFWFVDLPQERITWKMIGSVTRFKDRLALWRLCKVDGYSVMSCYLQDDEEGKNWKVVKKYKELGRLSVFPAWNVNGGILGLNLDRPGPVCLYNIDEDEARAVFSIGKLPDGEFGFIDLGLDTLSCLVAGNNLHLPLTDILGGAAVNGL